MRPKRIAKFPEFYQEGNINDCWEWQGFKGNVGYGFYHAGPQHVNVLAHRISWMLHNNSDWPQGLEASHTCHNRACVNPHHIIPSTHYDNIQLSIKNFTMRNRRVKTPHGEFSSVAEAARAGKEPQYQVRNRIKAKTMYHDYYYL